MAGILKSTSKFHFKPVQIRHETVYLENRQHDIDIFVLPVCQTLWDAGIETFYSCQGGPCSLTRNGKIYYTRAYVQVFEKDAKKVCKLLKGHNPEIDIHKKRVHKDRCAVRFDPSESANNILITFR